MNVLEYTEEQLKELSIDELKILLKEAEDGESLFNTQQMSAKLRINSLYGALGNRHFPLFNQAMAQAITGNGRYFIASLGNLINLRLSEKLGYDNQFTVAGDTDSVVGSSKVSTSEGNIKIENLFDNLKGEIEIRGENNYIKHLNSSIFAESLNMTTGKIESKRINYVMKHKVKKRMFKIKHRGDEVTVTEDHSVIIKRNNVFISVKPLEILKTDKIIKL
jgi:DNA polymerase elongation subunit (family B)